MRFSIVVVSFAAAFASSLVACSGPDKGELVRKAAVGDAGGGSSTRAAVGSFRIAGVNLVFERRCGSLDCHGSTERNMRVYSARGLRLPNDAGLVPGGADSTQLEISATYQSIMTLEPEVSNDVIDGADPYKLLILKKPLEIEKHKGGPAIFKGDDAETCIVSWLKEDPDHKIDTAACARAAIFPKP